MKTISIYDSLSSSLGINHILDCTFDKSKSLMQDFILKESCLQMVDSMIANGIEDGFVMYIPQELTPPNLTHIEFRTLEDMI